MVAGYLDVLSNYYCLTATFSFFDFYFSYSILWYLGSFTWLGTAEALKDWNYFKVYTIFYLFKSL